ncbi:PREDICTED: uncharacterized protein LOC104719462 [Camelina sativa]|uniref:Uncharacterized protein LOC104719462 n=1 Tax=Camelina sativa TaxID=90675 RepID=A0ABM0U4J7_CAMSA|nr:PREDICTED: uncharacterized protein LOC104719462 [Camelina sativa]
MKLQNLNHIYYTEHTLNKKKRTRGKGFFLGHIPSFPFFFPSPFFCVGIKTPYYLIIMGNCLVGRNNENVGEQEQKYEEVMKKDYKRKDRKVKIVLTRAELEKLILFQLNADGANKGGDASLASFGDFLKELEEERLAGEAAAAEEEKSRQRLCRRWKPSLKSVIEWPEEV